MGLTHSSGLPWSKASLLCHVFFTEDLCAHILTLPTHHCSHLPNSILLNSQGQFLYLSFYSTLKRYKRSHDWDENKITLWLITKIVSARTLGRSGEWDGGVNLCWRKPLIFINFIFLHILQRFTAWDNVQITLLWTSVIIGHHTSDNTKINNNQERVVPFAKCVEKAFHICCLLLNIYNCSLIIRHQDRS